jgi:hypothetical protein
MTLTLRNVPFGFATGPGTEAGVVASIGLQYPATGVVRGQMHIERRMLGRDGAVTKTGDVGSLPVSFDPADFAAGAHTIPLRTVATDAVVQGQTVDLGAAMAALYSIARYVLELERARLQAIDDAAA